MSEALSDGQTFEFEGKTYTVAPDGPGVRKQYVAWLKASILADIDTMRPDLNPAQFDSLEDKYVRQLGAKAYEWGNDVCQESLLSLSGLKQQMLIRLRVKHPEVSEALAGRMVDSLSLKRILMLFGYQLREEGEAPKEEAPAGADSPTTTSFGS